MKNRDVIGQASETLARATSRRSALKFLGVAMATVSGVLVAGSGVAAATSRDFQRLPGRPATDKTGPNAIDACGIWCEPVDCCPAGCCTGIYLFKCTNQCSGEFWYGCQTPPCSSYCQTTQC